MTRLLSIPQVAEALSCSVQTVYRLIAANDIATVDISASPSRTRTRVREQDLARFVEARTSDRARSAADVRARMRSAG